VLQKLIFLFLLFLTVELSAQFDHQAVFPDLEGMQLLQQLKGSYKPNTVLDFGEAKDVMYAEIYAINDSVSCVYSDHTLYLDPGADPSQYLYLNGTTNGINAEHNYPRSKGADNGNAKSDMYNLFPSRVQINSDRANLPFGEIPDHNTDFWYYLDDRISNIPADLIDSYSEQNENYFEPREDHKGNVARAIFYFVTMYDQEVQSADPNYFEGMRNTLCDWHYYDPVDSLEWYRNSLIASYQSGKQNPFTLDCSLAGRSYCDFINDECITVDTEEAIFEERDFNVKGIFPNPAVDKISIECHKDFYASKIRVLDMLGNTQKLFDFKELNRFRSAQSNYEIEIEFLPPGCYIVVIEEEKKGRISVSEKFIIVKTN